MAIIAANELLASKTFRALRRGLDFLVDRQELGAENIANVDTPGYKAHDLNFQAHLDRIINPPPPKLVSTDPRHFNGPEGVKLVSTERHHLGAVGTGDDPQPQLLDGHSIRNDENTVDIDREMWRLAETQLAFDTYSRMMNARIQSIQIVARDVR